MTQGERDRLVVLKKAQKRLITQKQAATELGVTERHVRRLLAALRRQGDQAVIHGLRGRASNRRLSEGLRSKAVAVLSQEVYRGFGPTLAGEYLARKHKLRIGREALRQIMMEAGLWGGRTRKVVEVRQWRPRRSCRGELVQWDTSEHDWLEGRGEKLYLIHMIDDATSELTARFVRHDSTEENMRLLWDYLERHGRPVVFYPDKASLFQTAPKVRRDAKAVAREQGEPLPPTQIGRALRELGIGWQAAHSPQAKGRVERSFGTAQDRLVKGLRVAGAKTLQQANRYLEEEFLPWWNQHLRVEPAHAADAHRPLGPGHNLAAALSRVETRQVGNDYTFRWDADSIRSPEPTCGPACAAGRCGSKPGWTAQWPCASRIVTSPSASASRGPS
jgi:transposase